MSAMGSLSECLVDFDADARGQARTLRRKALALSLFFEALLLAAMLIWPLVTPGVLPRQYTVDPLPPIGGGGRTGRNHPSKPLGPARENIRRPPICILCALPMIPSHPDISGDSPAPPDISGGDAVGGSGPGTGLAGPGVPAGTGDRSPFDLMKPDEAPPPAGPVIVSQGVMEAALIQRVQPEYPAVARAARISGRVELRAIIGKDGTVRHLQVESGNPLLTQAAVAAVRKWRYRPTLLSGRPVEVETHITVDFRLQ